MLTITSNILNSYTNIRNLGGMPAPWIVLKMNTPNFQILYPQILSLVEKKKWEKEIKINSHYLGFEKAKTPNQLEQDIII